MQDEKPFYCPPASSISLQINKAAKFHKAPVERLEKGNHTGKHCAMLMQTHANKWDPASYSSMIVDLYNSTMTNITRSSRVSPLELSLCDCWLCPHCAVSERKHYQTMTYSRHSVGPLWAVSMYMHVCTPTVHSSTSCFCFSLSSLSSFFYCGSRKKNQRLLN